MGEMFSLWGESSNSKENTSKELADVAIGAGLIVAGPAMAESIFNETSSALGADISFLPQNELIANAVHSGIDVAQGLTGIGVAGMLLYIGGKKLLRPFSNKQ